MHAKSSHNTPIVLGFWKDVGHLKNRNGWQFVGDEGSSQFTVTICCNAPLCFAELVHWMLYTLRPGLYVDITYIYSKWTNSATQSGVLQRVVTMNCDDPPFPKTVNHLSSSDVWRTFRSQVQFVSYGCFLREFSWVCWGCLRIRKIWYLSGCGSLILSFWQNGKTNRTNS